jgi:hypothetical protein
MTNAHTIKAYSATACVHPLEPVENVKHRFVTNNATLAA